MKCEIIKINGTWRDIADAARTTVNMDRGTGEPSNSWKKHMLLSQHSPIRKMTVNWKWIDIPYWVSVHLVRHKVGIEHFVSTQRSDRTGVCRDELPQNAPVVHECIANLESIMFISRRRLCNCASPLTTRVWSMFIDELRKFDPVVASCCVPECVYRGFCPEQKSCGYCNTEMFDDWIGIYRNFKV